MCELIMVQFSAIFAADPSEHEVTVLPEAMVDWCPISDFDTVEVLFT